MGTASTPRGDAALPGDADLVRVCTGCDQTKPIEQFSIKIAATGRRHARCRACTSDYNAAYYAQRAAILVPVAHGRTVDQRARLKAIRSEFITNRTCQECGTLPATKIVPPAGLTNGKSLADVIRNGWNETRFIGLLTAAEEAGGVRCTPCTARATSAITATAVAA